MQRKCIFDDEGHKWVVFGRDSEKPDSVIDTNTYIIVDNDEGMILDPGGTEIFPSVLSEVSKTLSIHNVKSYLCSHQDPDIMSSLPLWMALTPNAKVYISWLWEKFIAHFGNQYVHQFINIPDDGLTIRLGKRELKLVPAHFCHSSGNFHLYDPHAKILFSGDMGAALIPQDYPFYVEDFERHVQYMEAFHIRWMPSNEAKNRWVKRVRRLDVKMICPQHGAIMKDDDVAKFLSWMESLDVGKTKE